MIYICALFFTVYNIMLFFYSKSLYGKEINILPYAIILTPINFSLVYASIYITEFHYDYIFMVAFLVLYSLEFKLLFNQSYIKTLFGTISYALNFFAMRTIFLSIISLVKQEPISLAILDIDTRLLATAITLFMRPFTLRKAMKTVSKDQIFMIFSNKNNLTFSLGILTITYIYQILTSTLIDVQTNSSNTTIFLLGVGIFCFGIYIATMAHAYEFSKLHLHQKNFNRLKTKIKKEEMKLEQLKTSASLDSFTETYTRKMGEEKLNEYVHTKQNFYAVYVDMDGLKIANDIHGHEEGDFYIRTVAHILTSVFSSEFVARMGGDEFLILGNLDDEYEIAKKVLISHSDVKNISIKYKKPYETSISYGVVEVDKKNNLTAQEILRLADKKMYDFKREHKKARA